MNQDEIIAHIPGADALVKHLGFWPSFHDAEVISLTLNRAGKSLLTVHTFASTNELTSTGHYVTEKHTIVSFSIHEISSLEVSEFNHQNVLSSLAVRNAEEGFELVLGSCYGIGGSIRCAQIQIEFEVGMPPSSVYSGTVLQKG